MYEVLAYLPATSDFTLELAVGHFASTTFTQFKGGKALFKNEPVRAELAKKRGQKNPSGFRVYYGKWAIVAWLMEGEDVLEDSRNHAEDDDLPAPSAIIASCSRKLSVYSDRDDPDFDNGDRFTEFTAQLRQRFGAFIQDYVNGGWWT
jgi:hypothetical protein